MLLNFETLGLTTPERLAVLGVGHIMTNEYGKPSHAFLNRCHSVRYFRLWCMARQTSELGLCPPYRRGRTPSFVSVLKHPKRGRPSVLDLLHRIPDELSLKAVPSRES